MALIIACDICGKPAIGNVRVEIIAENVKGDGTQTGAAMEQHLCATCRPAAIVILSEQAQANLEMSILAP